MAQDYLKYCSSLNSVTSSQLLDSINENNISNFSSTFKKHDKIYNLSHGYSQISAFSNFSSNPKISIYFTTNEYYQGEINENYIPNGIGYYFYPNKEYYFGNFLNGKREGKGTYKYKDGTQYKGEWKNNKKNGEGVIVNIKEKWEFIGKFENDFPIEGIYNKLNELSILTDFIDDGKFSFNDNDNISENIQNSIISFSNKSNENENLSFIDNYNDYIS